MKKWLAVGVLGLWIAVLFATHFAAQSPYSYGWAIFNGYSKRLLGTVVNPDAIVVYPVTLFFYDGETPRDWGESPNYRLPMHSFAVATAAAFTRSYLIANDAANVGALMLLALVGMNAALRRQLRVWPACIALLTIATLPFVAAYIGQPMHYAVGITINFLAVIAASALDDDELRKPWISGLLVAIVMLNYDPYIFAAAIAVHALFVVRFRRVRDVVVFAVIAAAPLAIWTTFMRVVTSDRLSRMIERTFVKPVIEGWMQYVQHPIVYALQPFLMPHVGLRIGFDMVLSMVYWPILILCVAGLWRLRGEIPRTRAAAIAGLLVLLFVLHQFGTAGFDWENNPRRALPVVLAVAFLYCWLADRLWDRRGWRAAFLAVLAISGILVMADTLLDRPVVQYLSTGQAMHANPKEAITAIRYMRFHGTSMPRLMSDIDPVWHDLGRARGLTRETAARFLFAQLFVGFFCCALLWLLARAKLLPRLAPAIAAGVWVVSVVRFV